MESNYLPLQLGMLEVQEERSKESSLATMRRAVSNPSLTGQLDLTSTVFAKRRAITLYVLTLFLRGSQVPI
jgi:hypothetical protein